MIASFLENKLTSIVHTKISKAVKRFRSLDGLDGLG
jgi:hypothetical protein